MHYKKTWKYRRPGDERSVAGRLVRRGLNRCRMRGTSVLVAGAGLAGLTAARELTKKGAAVTVIDARDRVGGRVFTFREPFLHGEHAEAGADLIDESQTEICKLIAEVGLRTAKILPGRIHLGPAGRCAAPHRRQARLGGSRKAAAARSARVLRQRAAMGRRRRGIARARIGRAVARSHPRAQSAQGRGCRPARFLSGRSGRTVAACARPISSPRTARPAARRCSASSAATIVSLPRSRRALGSRVRLQTILRRVTQTRDGITAALESNGRVAEARFDYLVCAMPATTVRDVVFEPALPEQQRQRTIDRQVRRCDENRAAVRSRAVAEARHSRARSARRCRLEPSGMATKRISTGTTS